jgi:DNA-binding transcriptional regulator YhcF (GntR family)
MQLWFSHRSGISLREQLVTQIVLGILSGDLPPGSRLPSTRELARRFRLHPNTASAGYRQLEHEGWVEVRRGSGVYVRDGNREDSLSPTFALDRLAANLFRAARELGVPLTTVRARLRHLLEMQPPDHFLVVERDEELRRILTLEIRSAVKLRVEDVAADVSKLPELLDGAVPVALPGTASVIRAGLPPGTDVLVLQVRSVPVSLAGWLPAPSGALVCIASRWPGFLKMSRTMLAAAGFQADGLIFRDARKASWQRGLKQAAAIVCDSVTAREAPNTCRIVSFPLLSDSSLAELRRYEEFVHSPLAGRSAPVVTPVKVS